MHHSNTSSHQLGFAGVPSALLLTLLALGGCGGSALSSGDGSGGAGSPSAAGASGSASAGTAGGIGAAGRIGVAGGANVGASCTIDGKTYPSGGGSFLGPDGCNRCSCLDGKLACTLLACDPAPGSCLVTPDGASYPDGTGDIPAGDGCNVCTCHMGTLMCTARPCKAPTPCGGFAGDTCGPDEYCAYGPEGMCGAADAQSICRPRPSACSTLDQPVCGCDGKTHTNTCSAAHEGSGVLRTGPCPGLSCVVGDVMYPDGTTNIPGPACSLCSCSNGTLSCDQRGC